MKENIAIFILIAVTAWIIAKIIILNNKVNEHYNNEFGVFGERSLKQEVYELKEEVHVLKKEVHVLKKEVHVLKKEVKKINKKLKVKEIDVISLEPDHTRFCMYKDFNMILKTTSALSTGDVFKHEGIFYEVNDFLEICKDTNEIKYSCNRI